MDAEKSSTVVNSSEQEETAMEKEVGSTLETPEESTELEKPHEEDKEAVDVNETEQTEKKTDSEMEGGSPKDESETKSVPGAVAPPEPDESSEKIPQPLSAVDTEPKSIQPEQQPVSKNDPEPLPTKTLLAEGATESEPEKPAESVLQAEIPPAKPVDAPSPGQDLKVETGAELQATMDGEAKEGAKEKTDSDVAAEPTKVVGEEGSVEDSSEKTPEAAKSENDTDATKEEDTVPAAGSLCFALLEKEQTKDALRTSRTLIVLRGLPGSGKSFLARAIANAYKERCTVICADQHGVKPESPESSADGYKALDEAVVACCGAEAASSVLIVVDDTNHTQDRLASLVEIAEENNLVAVFLEPQTEWCKDPAQLTKKTRRGLNEAQLEAMKGQLEEMSIPYYFGWFLLSSVQEKIGCTSMDFLKTLDTLEAFKKHITDFTGKAEKEVDLEQYFETKGTLHCTTKFCNYGKAEGAKEYAQKSVVKDFYGSTSELSLTALFVTPRTVGARVSLTEEQLLLWPDEAGKDAESVPPAATLPPGSRAHITLGCAEDVEPVQTGLDLLEILALQQEGQQGEQAEEMELGSLTYYGEGRWLLSLREPICAPAIFSGFYTRKEVEQTIKEPEKKKKPKCTIL